nr:MAG TPA: hypothetical protein [Caudoviricetes sp.]
MIVLVKYIKISASSYRRSIIIYRSTCYCTFCIISTYTINSF